MHIQRLVKIHLYLLKLSSGNENMDLSWGDNSVKNCRNLPITNPKAELHNIKIMPTPSLVKNPLMFTKVIVRKQKRGWTYGRTADGRTDGRVDGHTDSQRDTIIPRHYRGAWFNK